MQQQSQQPQDQVSLLAFRVEALERTVSGFNQQLNSYVREKENDLKLKMLEATAQNIGSEITGFKHDVRELEEEVKALKDDLQRRDAAQHESQSRLQIRVLVAIISTVLTVVTSILGLYIAHIFK